MNTANPAPVVALPASLWAASLAWTRALVRRAVEPRRAAQKAASTVSLKRGATTWLAEPLGHRVTCESGTLWLCFDGEPLDIVLEPGETHLCAVRPALSIHALTPAVFRLA